MNSEIIYENPEEHNESSCEINHKKTKKSVAKDNQDEIYLNGAQLNPSPTNIESTQFKQKQDEHPQQHVPPSLAISVNGQSMQISNSTEITRTQDSIEEFFTSRAQNDVKTGIMIQYPCVTIRSQTTRNKAEIQQYDPYNPQQNSKKMFLNNSLEESKGLFFKTDKSGKSMALTNSSANTSQLGGSSCLKASVEVSFDSRGSNSSFPKVMNINQNYFSNMLENSLPQQSESFFKNNLIQQCLILFDSEKNFIKQRLPEDSISLQKSKDLFLSKSKEMKFSTYSFIPRIEEVNEDEFKMAKSYPQKPRVPSQDETANSTGSPKGNYKFQDEEINQEQKKEELVQNSEEDEVQKNDDKPEQDYEFMECDQKFRTYLNLESDIKVYKQNLAEDDLRFFEMIQVKGKNLDSQLKLGIQYMDSTNNWVPTIIDDNQNIIVVNSSTNKIINV